MLLASGQASCFFCLTYYCNIVYSHSRQSQDLRVLALRLTIGYILFVLGVNQKEKEVRR